MKKHINATLAAMAVLLAVPAQADDLQAQLMAVAQAEQDGQAREEAKRAAEEMARQKAAKAAAAERQRQIAAAAAAKKAKAAQQAAVTQAKEQERLTDKKRAQDYEDKLRELELMKAQLELERMKKRVGREDDFIDQELKRESARTDVIQSEADATRDVATGTRDLLSSEGKAREEEASGWFN